MASKVKAINDKHGPFEALLCLGDLFTPYNEQKTELGQDELDLLNGTLKRKWKYKKVVYKQRSLNVRTILAVPVPVYFASCASLQPKIQSLIAENLPRVDEETPIEIIPGVFFLGKVGVYRLPSGLCVAVAGGCWDASKWSESSEREFDELEVRRLFPFRQPVLGFL